MLMKHLSLMPLFDKRADDFSISISLLSVFEDCHEENMTAMQISSLQSGKLPLEFLFRSFPPAQAQNTNVQ